MVCRQWRMASAHEDFWKRLSFEGENVTEEKGMEFAIVFFIGAV